MRMMGIDPGTATTGYSIVDVSGTNNISLVETSVILTSAAELMHNRLNMLYQGLSKIAKRMNPDVMIVEKLFFNTNIKTAITVGQARGISLLVASEYDMDVFEYTALEAKKYVTGYGRASKQEIQEAVKVLMKLPEIVKPDDACDAVAIVLCHLSKSVGAFTVNPR